VARRLIHLLHPSDNVVTALADLATGAEVDEPSEDGVAAQRLTVRSPVAFGHKLALVAIARGEPVIKYGEVIGLATVDIAAGEHVHVHNVESQRGRGDLASKADG
jgi:altronate dehydratase small subunit